MDLKRQKTAETSSGVPADGPQTPKSDGNGGWGAGGWTARDGMAGEMADGGASERRRQRVGASGRGSQRTEVSGCKLKTIIVLAGREAAGGTQTQQAN